MNTPESDAYHKRISDERVEQNSKSSINVITGCNYTCPLCGKSMPIPFLCCNSKHKGTHVRVGLI